MATWPAGLPAPQKKISITPGDTRIERKLQSGRTEFRRFGDGKPDQAKLLFRLLWAQWETFKTFYEYDLNLGLNWFSASWLTTLGYNEHKAKFLGYPREVARQGYYVDIVCTLMVQKTAWIIGEDTLWPCATTGGGEPPPSDYYGYIYGGHNGTNDLQDCDQYNADLDIWAFKADMPSPGGRALAASTISSSGYIYGGNGDTCRCDEYTPDTWVSKSNMPTPGRYYLAASTIGSSGYIYGGSYSSNYYQDCDQYTPDTWISKTDMPTPARHGLAASTIDSSGYVYGGRDEWGSYLQDCDQYFPDTWTSKANMPAPARRYSAASTIGSSGYIYGGENTSRYQDCDQYTPDVWTSKSDMPSPARYGLAASTIGSSSSYVYGGCENQVGYSGGILQDCDQYTLDTWVSKSNMPSPARNTLAASTI